MAWITGTRGNDTLRGGSGNDSFWDNEGDDTVYGGGGNDTFYAGNGNDTFYGETGSDTVSYANVAAHTGTFLGFNGVVVSLPDGLGGETGSQTGDHYSSIENVTGSNFSDLIWGDGNANVIRGLDGNDYIEGQGGGDTLDGGNGIDTLSYANSTARVVVDILNNTASGGHATGDIISAFENLSGSAFNDSLSGTNSANLIQGGAGNDSIYGRGGNDRIEGGEGNDMLNGGSGADTFVYRENSNSGSDRIVDFTANDRIEFDADGSATVGYSYTFDTSTNAFDVIITLSDTGSILLDNVAIGDLDAAMHSVDWV